MRRTAVIGLILLVFPVMLAVGQTRDSYRAATGPATAAATHAATRKGPQTVAEAINDLPKDLWPAKGETALHSAARRKWFEDAAGTPLALHGVVRTISARQIAFSPQFPQALGGICQVNLILTVDPQNIPARLAQAKAGETLDFTANLVSAAVMEGGTNPATGAAINGLSATVTVSGFVAPTATKPAPMPLTR